MKINKNTFLLSMLLLVLSVFSLGGCGGDGGSAPDQFAQWAGEWKSMQTFLRDPLMDPAYEKIADKLPDYTPEGVQGMINAMYDSPVKALKIVSNTITFTIGNSPEDTSVVSGEYEYKGKIPMKGYEGYFWHSFEKISSPEKATEELRAYTYVLTTDVHSDSPDSMKHWHFRCGNESFEELQSPCYAMSFPTMVHSETTAEEVAEDTLGAAEEYANMFKEMPPLGAWEGEWTSMAEYLKNDSLMQPAYEATVKEAAKLGKNYSVEEIKAFFEKMYSVDFPGMSIDGRKIRFLDAESKVIAESNYAFAGNLPVTGHHGYWSVFIKNDDGTGYSSIIATIAHGGEVQHWHMRYGNVSPQELVDWKDQSWGPTFVKKGTTPEAVARDHKEDAYYVAKMLPPKK